MKAILLAAGYGTRLYPLTKDKPKALLSIANKPLINYIIEKIQDIKEIDEIFIVTNNNFYNSFINWLNDFKTNKKIKVINDNTDSNETRLGGLGDLNFVIENENINDDILIVNSDNLFEDSLVNVYKFFKQKGDCICLSDVKDLEVVKKMGVVEIDKNNKIIRFEEKPIEPFSTLSSTGVYFYKKETIKKIKEYLEQGNNPDGPGYFLQHSINKLNIYGYLLKGRWFDIGSTDQYKEADLFMRK